MVFAQHRIGFPGFVSRSCSADFEPGTLRLPVDNGDLMLGRRSLRELSSLAFFLHGESASASTIVLIFACCERSRAAEQCKCDHFPFKASVFHTYNKRGARRFFEYVQARIQGSGSVACQFDNYSVSYIDPDVGVP